MRVAGNKTEFEKQVHFLPVSDYALTFPKTFVFENPETVEIDVAAVRFTEPVQKGFLLHRRLFLVETTSDGQLAIRQPTLLLPA